MDYKNRAARVSATGSEEVCRYEISSGAIYKTNKFDRNSNEGASGASGAKTQALAVRGFLLEREPRSTYLIPEIIYQSLLNNQV